MSLLMSNEMPPARLLWTVSEAASALSMSERNLWQKTKEGKIPVIRIDKLVRYDPRALADWIARQQQGGK